jgi:hypothetical protein
VIQRSKFLSQAMEHCLAEQPRNSQSRNAPLPVLEGIEEEGVPVPADKWPPTAVRPPETPTETMEFLARSWSLSAAEISKALKVLGSKATSDAPAIVATTTTTEEQSGEGAVGAMSPASRANLDVKVISTHHSSSTELQQDCYSLLVRSCSVARGRGRRWARGSRSRGRRSAPRPAPATPRPTPRRLWRGSPRPSRRWCSRRLRRSNGPTPRRPPPWRPRPRWWRRTAWRWRRRSAPATTRSWPPSTPPSTRRQAAMSWRSPPARRRVRTRDKLEYCSNVHSTINGIKTLLPCMDVCSSARGRDAEGEASQGGSGDGSARRRRQGRIAVGLRLQRRRASQAHQTGYLHITSLPQGPDTIQDPTKMYGHQQLINRVCI